MLMLKVQNPNLFNADNPFVDYDVLIYLEGVHTTIDTLDNKPMSGIGLAFINRKGQVKMIYDGYEFDLDEMMVVGALYGINNTSETKRIAVITSNEKLLEGVQNLPSLQENGFNIEGAKPSFEQAWKILDTCSKIKLYAVDFIYQAKEGNAGLSLADKLALRGTISKSEFLIEATDTRSYNEILADIENNLDYFAL